MSDIRVITNNVPRDVIDACFLNADERAEFDYLDWDAIENGNESASFFRYKGSLYDLGDFMRWDGPPSVIYSKWDGYSSDTFFSATVVRYVENGEAVVVGRIYT
jgi:hypothetical protein